MKIDRNDFERWKLSDPVTREVLKMMAERKLQIGEQMCDGACLGSESEHGIAVGRSREIDDFINLKYDDLFDKVEIKTPKE